MGLSWEADTRLVVHFADIAAHGSRYNERRANLTTGNNLGKAGCCSRWPDNGHPSGADNYLFVISFTTFLAYSTIYL